jgi:cytokinin dehydrogenase
MLDGGLLFDDVTRQAFGVDNGGHVRRVPWAVLKAGSVDDIVRTVTYANKHGLKIAMRGQGHCQYGQAQVEAGIVIDSSALNAIRLRGRFVDAQPGALWGEVAKIALEKDLIPPVMPDAMMLTVGGTLSVGGIGETSYRHGAQVDHVIELDVVTGNGELTRCSREENSELFDMTLAGMGQCAIIVRARLRLVDAPRFVAIHPLHYDELNTFLSDQGRLTNVETLGMLNGQINVAPDGRSRFTLLAGVRATTSELPSRSQWGQGLQFSSAGTSETTSFWQYLNRRAAAVGVNRSTPFLRATLVATLSDDTVRPFLNHVLSTNAAFAGIWFFEVGVRIPARHRQPLQKVPNGPLAFELRMQRRALASETGALGAMLAANHALVTRLQLSGGKIYPPYCPTLSKTQWNSHFGPETWFRFVTAKRRFDPEGVLTPGAGIFGSNRA